MEDWKRATQGRGPLTSCLPDIQLKERAIRWAHKLYEEEHGKTPIKAFCQALMNQLGISGFIPENAPEAKIEGDKSQIKNIYAYALNELKERENAKRTSKQANTNKRG